MEAKELRIGNLVDLYGSIATVIRHDFNIRPPKGLAVDKGKPITLSEEWLLKFGGILQPWGWVINDILINFTKHPKERYWIELGNGKRIELPYVHTLQNFFALTGKELEIK